MFGAQAPDDGYDSSTPLRQAGSTDSGIVRDDYTRTPLAASPADPTTPGDEVFLPPVFSVYDAKPSFTSDSNYVPLDIVKASIPTSSVLTPDMSTDYVDNSLLSLCAVHALWLPHSDVAAASTSQQDVELLAAPGDHTSSSNDAVNLSTRQHLTTDAIPSVSCSEEERGSALMVASTTATCPLDATQPYNRNEQSNAVRTDDSSSMPAYITLEQLSVSPSNCVFGDRMHSNDSTV